MYSREPLRHQKCTAIAPNVPRLPPQPCGVNIELFFGWELSEAWCLNRMRCYLNCYCLSTSLYSTTNGTYWLCRLLIYYIFKLQNIFTSKWFIILILLLGWVNDWISRWMTDLLTACLVGNQLAYTDWQQNRQKT